MTKLKGKARQKANKKKRLQAKNDYFLRRKKMLSLIRKWDDPVLKEKCELVQENEDVSSIIKDLKSVLRFSSNGIGLAASQIGHLKSIIAIRPDREKGEIKILINPKITKVGDEIIEAMEGCLSYPNKFFPIERSKEITVKFTNKEGKEVVKECKEIEARIIIHECDHTQGICFVGDGWRKEQEEELNEAAKEQDE